MPKWWPCASGLSQVGTSNTTMLSTACRFLAIELGRLVTKIHAVKSFHMHAGSFAIIMS